MEMLLSGLTVTGLEAAAWVVAVVAGVALLLSPRAPRLGSHLGWAYPTAMAVTSVALLVADTAWWLTRSDPRAAAVAGVAGLWRGRPPAREGVRVLDRGRDDLVAVVRKRVHGARDGR